MLSRPLMPGSGRAGPATEDTDHEQVQQTDGHEPGSCLNPPDMPNRRSRAAYRVLKWYRHAARHQKARGLGKPETFDFLCFTHICSGRGGPNMPVTSASAGRESLSDGGVPGRGPTQPIAPYRPIRHSAELSIR